MHRPETGLRSRTTRQRRWRRRPMSEEDFQERDHPANRERDRARLVRVSSAAGVETGAPASAGAPVLIPTGWKDLADSNGDRYCRAPEGFVYYWRHDDQLDPDVDEK